MRLTVPLLDGPRPLATTQPWAVCGCSRGQWYRLLAAGHAPLPTARLGTRRPVYSVRELELWLLHGAPGRARWQALRDAALRGEVARA